jgi:adenosyl cobinamide kinase/adenosyl cobinamide phosphate guanylyltransferase
LLQNTLELDFSCPGHHRLHLLIWARLEAGLDPLAYLQQHQDLLTQSIIICDDVSCGVVPVDPALRLWRETAGRCTVWLAREASSVIRVFCGLATPLKP